MTSLQYLNGIKSIDPDDKKRNFHPYLPLHARLMVRKLKRREQENKEQESHSCNP